MHRVGRHDIFEGPKRRRCLTPDEMLTRGMGQNRFGHWTQSVWEGSKSLLPFDLETPQRTGVVLGDREVLTPSQIPSCEGVA